MLTTDARNVLEIEWARKAVGAIDTAIEEINLSPAAMMRVAWGWKDIDEKNFKAFERKPPTQCGMLDWNGAEFEIDISPFFGYFGSTVVAITHRVREPLTEFRQFDDEAFDVGISVGALSDGCLPLRAMLYMGDLCGGLLHEGAGYVAPGSIENALTRLLHVANVFRDNGGRDKRD